MIVSDYFDAVLGQSQAIQLLTQATIQRRIAPAYLFVGVAGIGKRLTARCWLEMLLCEHQPDTQVAAIRQKIRQGNHPDLLWVEPTYNHQGQLLGAADAAAAGAKKKTPPQIRIEQIRQITQFLSQPPLLGDRAVVVIEQAETMAEGAANALLKTLEEPGSATLILLTNDSSTLLSTLISRCQCIPFQRLPTAMVYEILTRLGRETGTLDPIELEMAQGSPGQAIALRDHLAAIPAEIKAELLALPKTLPQTLRLAKQIDRELDAESQLVLLDYLHYAYWRQFQNPTILKALTTSRQQLLAYVQPRLVWECLCLSLKIAK